MYAFVNLFAVAACHPLFRLFSALHASQISSVGRLLNSAQVGPADIFVELDSLMVGDTKPRFRTDAGIEREDWSAPNISLAQPCASSRSGEALVARATKPKH
jgi:hypothetical protein